jgi:DNA-directed RNA polymerase specialized sigma24 family protein
VRQPGWVSPDPVEHDDALYELPAAYAVGLRLRARGVGHAEIAELLGIELEAVESLLEIAERKLESLTRSTVSDS